MQLTDGNGVEIRAGIGPNENHKTYLKIRIFVQVQGGPDAEMG
jgi:hypothetical protein